MRVASKMKEPVPTAADCAKVVLDVTPVIIQALRYEMRKMRLTDLSVPQFRTLAYIRSNPGASLSAAAEFIGLTLSSMSILVNGLVARGLVNRSVASADRRRVHLTLTTDGDGAFTYACDGTEHQLATIMRGLNAEERTTVVRALELLRPLFQPGAAASSAAALNPPEHEEPAPRRPRKRRAAAAQENSSASERT